MRRFLVLAAALVLATPLAACCSDSVERAPVSPRPVAAAPTAPACACAPASAPAYAPAYAYVAEAPVAVEFRTGAEEKARAVIAIPPEVLGCAARAGSKIVLDAIEGIQCALQALIPHVTPSQRYVYAPPPAYFAPTAPCAPPPSYSAPPPCAPPPVPLAPPPSAAPCR